MPWNNWSSVIGTSVFWNIMKHTSYYIFLLKMAVNSHEKTFVPSALCCECSSPGCHKYFPFPSFCRLIQHAHIGTLHSVWRLVPKPWRSTKCGSDLASLLFSCMTLSKSFNLTYLSIPCFLTCKIRDGTCVLGLRWGVNEIVPGKPRAGHLAGGAPHLCNLYSSLWLKCT